MTKKSIVLLALVLSTIFSFAKPASLKGKVLNNSKYKEIQLQDLSYNTIETQTIKEDGSFEFEKKFNDFDFYLLVFEKGNFVVFFPEPGENTEITIDLKDLKTPIIKNSIHSQLYYDYSNQLAKISDAQKRENLIQKMFNEHPNSPTCILFAGILSPDRYAEYHQKLSEGLKNYTSSAMVQDFIKQTNNIKNLAVGGEAPEIELNSPDGKAVKLSSTRGNYVLIDFWAAWCRPCRMENPNNVKLYEKYHDKGFEIYAVSLDKERDAWLKAIKDDNLSWIHVSDLKFWQSEAAKTYNVRGIPHTVLLDKDGEIIDIGLRGDALKKKLEQIFGE